MREATVERKELFAILYRLERYWDSESNEDLDDIITEYGKIIEQIPKEDEYQKHITTCAVCTISNRKCEYAKKIKERLN